MSDKLIFAKEPQHSRLTDGSWKLLIVDDEAEVHNVTTLALDGFTYAGKNLQFLSAFSGYQAKQIIRDHADIALVLLDVVMETPDAGLDVANFIRNELGNKDVRILLRTGQPGSTPQYEVITRFGINDYKEKTELTQKKLYTAVHASLSAYSELKSRDTYVSGLTKILAASAQMFDLSAIHQFKSYALEQLISLLCIDQDPELSEASAMMVRESESRLHVVAGVARFKECVGELVPDSTNAVIQSRINEAFAMACNHHGGDYFTAYYKIAGEQEYVLYASATAPLAMNDMSLLDIFVRNIAVAHQNVKSLRGIPESVVEEDEC